MKPLRVQTKRPARIRHKLLVGSVVCCIAAMLGVLLFIILSHYGYTFRAISSSNIAQRGVTPKPSQTKHTTTTPANSPLNTQITPDVHIPPSTDGLVPIVASLTTNQPVVFLTVDDGAHKTPDELQTLVSHHTKATLFLSRLFIADNPTFFTDFQTAGYPIENHSLEHLIDEASIESYAVQKTEICGMADYEEKHYGRRPIFFRPPGGSYSTQMRQAATDCGMKAIITWSAKANNGSMQYQDGDHLRPGDIVLMHFRPEFENDLKAFLDAQNHQHLQTELLEDWL